MTTTTPERPARDLIAHTNSHGPLARLARSTEAGTQLWDTWHGHFRDEQLRLAGAGLTTISTTDDNQHGHFGLGKGWTHIGGKGIDDIGITRATGGAKVRLGAEKRCNLTIDGHDGWGRELTVTFPSATKLTFWVVQANLGRHDNDAEFLRNAHALLSTFGLHAVYGFDEIDEADAPDEHALLAQVFSKALGFTLVGFGTMSPIAVGPVLEVVRARIHLGSPGMAKVSPDRPIVSAVYRPAGLAGG